MLPMHTATDVSIRNIDLYYGNHHVLKDNCLDIKGGEFFAFLGPSGCGKTSLLRLIAGFNKARSGSILIGGRDVVNLPPWKRDVGMVFQSYALWPHMTIRRNVAFGLEERRLPRAEIERRVEAALTLVGMAHLSERRPSQLSGGQQQRVALARTIAIEPTVLLLDEPLSNLDAALRVQVRRELLAMQRRLGLTTIFVTHDQEEANSICDRIAILKDGRVQQVGRPMDIYDQPNNLFVAGFLGSANVVGGTVDMSASGPRLILPGGCPLAIPPALDKDRCKAFFRPSHTRLLTVGSQTSENDVILHGQLEFHEFLGANVRYFLQLETGETVSADIHHESSADQILDPSKITGIAVARDKITVLPE